MITINDLNKSENFFLMAGPCVIEGEDMALRIADKIVGITERLHIPYVFKGSYRKANRSRLDSFTGIGDEKALKIFRKVPLPEVLRSVRDEILDNGAEIEAAIREAKGFVLDESNKLKRLPKGYAPGSPYDEWLKLKDVYITERLAPEFMLDKELLKNTLHEFRKTKHFSDILNRAVQFAYDEMI